ncbi:MAG: hypothetical protein GX881_02210 [Firmicutes bacterium]|nr:hypothetical protein [Bacillota bacterium]
MKNYTAHNITAEGISKVGFEVALGAGVDTVWAAAEAAMLDACGHRNVTCWREEKDATIYHRCQCGSEDFYGCGYEGVLARIDGQLEFVPRGLRERIDSDEPVAEIACCRCGRVAAVVGAA